MLALTVYWLARWAAITGRELLIVYGLFFAALVAVALVLSYVGEAGRWLSRTWSAGCAGSAGQVGEVEDHVHHDPDDAVDRGQREAEVGVVEAAALLAGPRPGQRGDERR